MELANLKTSLGASDGRSDDNDDHPATLIAIVVSKASEPRPSVSSNIDVATARERLCRIELEAPERDGPTRSALVHVSSCRSGNSAPKSSAKLARQHLRS